jgi:transcriptional regulator with XRE-family HTH domain
MPFDAVQLGERIMLARRRLGWTQSHFADKSGVRAITVTRVERGKMPHVSLAVVYNMAVALGASLDALTGRGEDAGSTPQE